jgi:hypothetical protein
MHFINSELAVSASKAYARFGLLSFTAVDIARWVPSTRHGQLTPSQCQTRQPWSEQARIKCSKYGFVLYAPASAFLTVLQREWNFWAVLGFSTVTLSTWEATSALFSAAYTNGGPASVVYGFIVSVLGTLMIAASMAEMASMLVVPNRTWRARYLTKL